MSRSMHADTDQGGLSQRYNPVAQGFHWLVVAMIVMQVTIALILPAVLPKATEEQVSTWHFAMGSSILAIMLLRLAWRLSHPPPPAPTDLPASLRLLSRATHWLFYGVLIVLPMLGWTAASAYGAPVRLFGLIPLPALVDKNKELAEAVGQVHETVAFGLLALIALHVAGALYHGLVKQDGVIRRMLPR